MVRLEQRLRYLMVRLEQRQRYLMARLEKRQRKKQRFDRDSLRFSERVFLW